MEPSVFVMPGVPGFVRSSSFAKADEERGAVRIAEQIPNAVLASEGK